MAGLQLEAVDFHDSATWHWVLSEEDAGAVIASHEVCLDRASWQFEAFSNLTGYLSWHVAPGQRAADEARIVGEVGAWIGSQVLGPIGEALADAAPVAVAVVVPPAAVDLLLRPLELAHARGRSLVVQGVTFIMDPGRAKGNLSPVGDRLRVLGLFSLPDGSQALNLRRERHSLVRLFGELSAAGKAIDVRALQYGVTRERLLDELADAEGWDVIHVSGHGSPGQVILETRAGTPDLVSAAQLAGLLEAARGRLKLVTVSACWSAAVTAAEQRRLLGLPVQDADASGPASDPHDARPAPGSLAIELTSRLGCAVLAMRYPVSDEFAIRLSARLYASLADAGQALPLALGGTLRQLVTEAEQDGRPLPLLFLATPTLFGRRAAGLRLTAPPLEAAAQVQVVSNMGGFPPPAERFVGRTGALSQAAAALAPDSGIPGVLLHGMPGGGKSACALELAYDQAHAFDYLVWYKAPDEGLDISGALTDFALTLERYVDDFQMASALRSPDTLMAFLPRLTELTSRRRLLLVIDNIDSLISGEGQWRDEQWALVIGALISSAGPGRLVLTSRMVPAGLTGLRAVPVNALTADESLLLTRELPHLNALKLGKVRGIDPAAARQLARRALNIAQGHPKLLELAEGQAAQPERLAELIEAGGRAWHKQGGLPEDFFASGPPSASPEDYRHVLDTWTRSITATLLDGERTLFWFLCCLEERNRGQGFVAHVWENPWENLWKRLGHEDQPPDLSDALTAVAACGLTSPRGEGILALHTIHPSIAAAGRDHAGESFRAIVDATAVYFLSLMYRIASGELGDGTVNSLMAADYGIAAIPYLIRQQNWDLATALMERAFHSDPTRQNATALLAASRQIASQHPAHGHVLHRLLETINPASTEHLARADLRGALERGDYRHAAVFAEELAKLCQRTGRLSDALTLAEQAEDYMRQTDLGPWTQISVQTTRLDILNETGKEEQVLTRVRDLLAQTATLPAATEASEAGTTSRAVREGLLDTGRTAARKLRRWQEALDLNAALATSLRDRTASPLEYAIALFNDYFPLLKLGRLDEAIAVLRDCLSAFRNANDALGIAKTLSALANAESDRGNDEAAIQLERDALRYHYLTNNVSGIAISYHDHGNDCHRLRQPTPALASHLAASLISLLANSSLVSTAIQSAATDLQEFGAIAVPPATVEQLCSQLDGIPGTDLPGLIASLCPDPGDAWLRLRLLVHQAQARAAAPAGRGAGTKRGWKLWRRRRNHPG